MSPPVKWVAIHAGVSGWRVFGVMVGRTARGFVAPPPPRGLRASLYGQAEGSDSVPSRGQETAEGWSERKARGRLS